MIPFFRKIRKKMADDNKSLKYMRYAIGEIVLVVIGILIALQINNWNQNSKNHIKEISILKALQNEYKENSKRYEQTIRMQQTVVVYSKSLIQCLEKKDLNYKRDSIDTFIMMGALNYVRAEPLIGTYQSLMGGDLSLVKNELLKSKLASFSAEIILGFEDEIASMNLLNQLHAELSTTVEPLLSTRLRKRYGLKQPMNTSIEYQNEVLLKMYQNPNILSPLIWKNIFENNRLGLQQKMLNYSNEILTLIETELKTLK